MIPADLWSLPYLAASFGEGRAMRERSDFQGGIESERLERAVEQRTHELKQALHERCQLLARICHDLRAPLAGMVDSARLLAAGDASRDYLRMVELQAKRQMDLIEELLEFSREELSDLRMEPVPGYLHAFLHDVAEQMEAAVEAHGNRLSLRFGEALPAVVWLDFHRLRRVLVNLLGNAAKFTERGNIRFMVERQTSESDGELRLAFTIQDEGMGMTPEELQRLIQPFARGSNAGRHEGYGLGLAIVTNLLEQVGSALHIDSAPGAGSRFHFVLSVTPGTESDLDLVLDDGHGADTAGSGQRILVVDDEPQQRDLLCDLFNSHGFDCRGADSAQKAMDLLKEQAIGLVITDQCMADCNGWVLLRHVRKAHAGTPVLLYSGLPPGSPPEMEPQFAFDDALLKPSSSVVLLRKAQALLDKAAKHELHALKGLEQQGE